MPPFPLLTLPFLPIKEIFKSMTPIELFLIAQVSRKSSKLVSLSISGNKEFGISCKEKGISINDTYIFKIDTKSKTSDFVWDNPRVRKNKVYCSWPDKFDGIRSLALHLIDLFGCPITHLIYSFGYDVYQFSKWLIDIKKRQKEMKKVWISGILYKSSGLEDDEFRMILNSLEGLKITEELCIMAEIPMFFKYDFNHLPKFIYISESEWFSFENLKSATSSVFIKLFFSDIKKEELEEFCWKQGKYPELMNLEIKGYGLQEERKDLENRTRRQRVVCNYLAHISNGVRIQGNNGQIAEISNGSCGFKFFVVSELDTEVNYIPNFNLKISDDTTCTSRTQPPTFLFAYSNDFDQQTILDTWNAFVDLEGQVNAQYSTFGSVRFDTKTQDSIQWNTNYKDVMSSIRNHLPDPSLGFGDSSTGSDVLNVLERYLNNGQIQVCGSNVMILLKRYPNTVDISRIVSIIRSHHAVVHVITSASPSGGTQSKTGYNLASKSNGLGAFEQDVHFSDTIPRFPLFATPFPIYTINVQVSGKGSIQLPLMSVPSSTYYYVSMTYQDHLPLDGFKKITLSWADDSFVETIDEANSREEGGTYTAGWSSFDAGTRSLTFDYEYSDSKLETLQIRISSDTPLNDWLPYAE